jgi:hypothetical protein
MAEEIGMVWRGMTLLLSPIFWRRRYASFDVAQIAAELKRLAKQVTLAHYKKVTRTSRKPPPKRRSSKNTPHLSTARLLEKRK